MEKTSQHSAGFARRTRDAGLARAAFWQAKRQAELVPVQPAMEVTSRLNAWIRRYDAARNLKDS